MIFDLTETSPLVDVVVKHAADAFVDEAAIAREWRALNFIAPPDLRRARDESSTFIEILRRAGASVRTLPPGGDVGLDSIYARDASIESPGGMILCRMGKPARAGEPAAQRKAFDAWGIPIAGEIQAPGTLEGGDVVWLGPRTVAIGRGYRTNDEGIRQFRALLGDAIDEMIVVPLPHWRGAGDVFHLMSILSPVDGDLAVVYAPLLPVPFRERLDDDLGYQLIEVPDREFDTMGPNVLAVGPRRCVMLIGNPDTQTQLIRAGAEVFTYEGTEISVKGGGGPTCLTRPIRRGLTA